MNNVEIATTLSQTTRDRVMMHAASDRQRISVVSAAPGSGKSTALLSIAKRLLDMDGVQRVAIAAQTNNQANDLGIKYAKMHGPENVYRFASTLTKKPAAYEGHWKTSGKDIEEKTDCVIIATAAKWGQAVAGAPEFQVDYVLVDEAFQMPWSTFVQVSCLGPNFILIGDEGQIPPVVPVDADRWETSAYPPHWPAPITFEKRAEFFGEKYLREELEYCWRLPEPSVKYIKPFYERLGVEVKAVPGPKDRVLTFENEPASQSSVIVSALNLMSDGAPVLLTVPDEEDGAPIDADQAVAAQVKEALRALFATNPSYAMNDRGEAEKGKVLVSDVAICSPKRAMNALIENSIQEVLAELPEEFFSPELKGLPNFGLKVDTPERLQGLEFKIFFAVHPLSNAQKPSEFDLETGRLCVMASRHQIGLLMFSREHIIKTLDIELPDAHQAPGRPDSTGLGHRLHRKFISMLDNDKRIVRATR